MTPKPKPSPNTDKYHVYQVSHDLGEVSGHKEPIDAINAAYNGTVAIGTFITVAPNGAVEIIEVRETSNVNVSSTLPKDLFK